MAPSPFLMTPQYPAGLKLGCQVGLLGVAALYPGPFAAVNGGSAAAGLGNPRKGRPAGGGRPNGTVRVDLAFTDRSIRQRFKVGNVFQKWIRRPGSAPDLVSGQQEKSGWVTLDYYLFADGGDDDALLAG